MNAAADAVTPGFPLALAPLMGEDNVVLVRLELRGADGQLVSDNFYWRAAHEAPIARWTGLRPLRSLRRLPRRTKARCRSRCATRDRWRRLKIS